MAVTTLTNERSGALPIREQRSRAVAGQLPITGALLLVGFAFFVSLIFAVLAKDRPHEYGKQRPPVDQLDSRDRGLQSKDVVAASDQMAMDLLALPELRDSAHRWLIAYVGLLVLSGFIQPYLPSSRSLAPNVITVFFVMNIGVVSTVTIILLAYSRGAKDKEAPPWSEIVLLLLAVAVSAYYIYHSHRIIYDLGYLYPTAADLVLGVVAIGLLLEACRRSIGLAFPVLVGIALAYAALGQYLPGVWGHGGFRWDDLVATFYLGPTGIYGSLMRISSTVIVIFVMFGALLVVTGGGDTFIRLSTAVAGRLSGGPAKAATLCSALFGSISGSTAAAAATAGAGRA